MSNPYDPYYGQYSAQPPVQQHHYYGGAPQPPPNNSMAVTSMVLGIISLVACGLTAPFAIIFGHMAQGQIKRTGEGGSGMAIAGLIMGYIVTALWIVLVLLYVFIGFAIWGASTTPTTY